MCSKRAFASEKAAKRAHRGAGWRLRTYRCLDPDCRKIHVTNSEKRRGRDRDDYETER